MSELVTISKTGRSNLRDHQFIPEGCKPLAGGRAVRDHRNIVVQPRTPDGVPAP